ncbi:MAG: hypothetical protein HY815_03770 [Candidatus Riflebacteria bacterium]|nr:hypothetical protein [Candidatus Riflebacteria bacterium]
MILDRSHIKWAAGCALIAAASTAHYSRYAAGEPSGPSGGTFEGLCYGVTASGLILFAASLSARRRFPGWLVGTGQHWLKAHIWISMLALPVVLFHSGLRVSGTMATLLVLLLAVVSASGIFGLVLQRFLPERMMVQCPTETVYEQIDQVLLKLREEARLSVEAAVGAFPDSLPSTVVAELRGGGMPASTSLADLKPGSLPLVDFYVNHLKPYLADLPSGLTDARARATHFEHVRRHVLSSLHPTLDDLASICHERSQLERQRRLHLWLHGWLFVHVPLSMLLVVLMCAHAVQALRF